MWNDFSWQSEDLFPTNCMTLRQWACPPSVTVRCDYCSLSISSIHEMIFHRNQRSSFSWIVWHQGSEPVHLPSDATTSLSVSVKSVRWFVMETRGTLSQGLYDTETVSLPTIWDSRMRLLLLQYQYSSLNDLSWYSEELFSTNCMRHWRSEPGHPALHSIRNLSKLESTIISWFSILEILHASYRSGRCCVR